MINFRIKTLLNPLGDMHSGVEATLRSFTNDIHNRFADLRIPFDYNIENHLTFQRKRSFTSKRIFENFFEKDVKTIQIKSSAKLFRQLCNRELKINIPYNGVNICRFLSEELNLSERAIILRCLCGIFF